MGCILAAGTRGVATWWSQRQLTIMHIKMLFKWSCHSDTCPQGCCPHTCAPCPLWMWLFFLECIGPFNHISLLLHKSGHWIFLPSWSRRPWHLMQLKAVPQIFENSYPLPLAASCMQLCFQELQSQETEGKMIVVVWGRERGVISLHFEQLQCMFPTPFIRNCKWDTCLGNQSLHGCTPCR